MEPETEMEMNVEDMDVNGVGTEPGDGIDNCLSSFVDSGSKESHRYFLARRTVLEMLRDRGYDAPASEIDLPLQAFRATYGQEPDVDRLRISVTHMSDPSKRVGFCSLFFLSFIEIVFMLTNSKILQMLVVFCGPGMVKVNVIRGITSQIINKDSLSGLILILQSHITSQAMKAADLFKFKVEMFQVWYGIPFVLLFCCSGLKCILVCFAMFVLVFLDCCIC